MAVTVPAAPVPPSPPAVPEVTLGSGGSVQDSTIPQSGQQTDAQRQEMQARQAVARGDGARSKMTQEQPEAKIQNGQKAQSGQQNSGVQANTTAKTDSQTAAIQDSGQSLGESQANTQTANTAAQMPSAPWGGSGAGYWAFIFAVVFVLAFVLFRVMMKKRSGEKGELTAEDIRQAITPESEDFSENLRGLTPDEALQRLEEQEAMETAEKIRKARAEAKSRMGRAAGRVIVRQEPSAAFSKQAAREYREQVTAMLPEERIKPVKMVRKPPKAQDGDKEHFEISV